MELSPTPENQASGQDIYELTGCLTQADLAWLNAALSALRADPEAVRGRAETSGRANKIYLIKEHTELRMKIESFFAQVFPFDRSAYSFYSANFYDLYNSYALHCDNLGDGRGYYQAVIPLEVPPQPTYTIVFDQTASENVEWISPFYRKPAGYKPFHNKPIYDASWFGNWRDEYRISEEDGAKYWGPAWAETFREAYKGFSIKCAYRWSVGDVLIFNSRFAHCASDLRQLGIEKKTGLLICLERKSR